MIDKTLILYNGTLVSTTDFSISTANRAFRYGDGLFETIKVSEGFPLFYRTHYSRLVRGLHALSIDIPDWFSFIYFKEKLIELIHENNSSSGSLRVQAYRAGKGTYSPVTSDFEWIVEFKPSSETDFFHNEMKDYRLTVYDGERKQPSQFSFFKSCNARIYIQAALHANKHGYDNSLILNTSGQPIETVAENLFIYKNGVVSTPPIQSGPVEGVMRSVVKKLLIWNKIDFQEIDLAIDDIANAEEIFLTNSHKGIVSVTDFQEKKYSREFTPGLQAKLNERVAQILGNKGKH